MIARTACGCTPPTLPPVPRDPVTIAEGLADAAERLAMLADRVHALGDDTGEQETGELDALAVGIGRATCELRMRQHDKDGAPCRD